MRLKQQQTIVNLSVVREESLVIHSFRLYMFMAANQEKNVNVSFGKLPGFPTTSVQRTLTSL